MKRSMETEKYVFVKMMGTKQLFAVRFVCSKSKYLYYWFGVGGEDTFFYYWFGVGGEYTFQIYHLNSQFTPNKKLRRKQPITIINTEITPSYFSANRNQSSYQ
jgi:hypothetical protein